MKVRFYFIHKINAYTSPSPGIVAAEGRPVGLLLFSVLGPMGRNVDDAYLLLQAQLVVDPRDPFSTAPRIELSTPLDAADLSSITAMITSDFGVAPMSDRYRSTFQERTFLFRHHLETKNLIFFILFPFSY